MSVYGALPASIGSKHIDCGELMLYLYLPIKLAGCTAIQIEKRLECFSDLLGAICCDYIGYRGLDDFVESYIYLTAKRNYVAPGSNLNRPGWHSDGYLTDDINYVWYDSVPTIFNSSPFALSPDDSLSMREMEEQAQPYNNHSFPEGSILRLDQFNVHRPGEATSSLIRTFVKVSFSKDKYDLLGNSKNFLLDYDWPMRKRELTRNMPQSSSPAHDDKQS